MRKPNREKGKQLTLITPPNRFSPVDIKEFWRSREIVGFLAWRDIAVRYKQTVLGVAWAILQPLVAMLVFTALFSSVAGFSTGSVPYPIFSLCGLTVWQFFSHTINDSSKSLVLNQSLVTKVYFPRITIPTSNILAGLLDLFISLIVLAILMAAYRFQPKITVLFLPFFIAIAVAVSLGIGYWLSSLSVSYRDFQYIIPFALQIGIFLTPVAYPLNQVPETYQFLLSLNPITGVVEGFRWCILGNSNLSLPLIATSAFSSLVILVSGVYYFNHADRFFSDRI